MKKISLRHNKRITDKEYALACALCDIISEVVRLGNASSPGGIFWDIASSTNAHTMHLRKNRKEIDASMLLMNRFRDFPTIIYASDKLTPKPDFWIRRYMRLCKGIAEKWQVRIPNRFGEIGWDVGGYPVNRHTAFLQERINAQLRLGMERTLSGHLANVLEIGGGSGEMAHVVCKNIPNISWYDCDLAHSLIYNAIHMAVWFPEKKHYIYVGGLPVAGVDESHILRSAEEAAGMENAVVNIPHFLLADFNGKIAFNLVLNAWSFSEMQASDARKYGQFIHDNLAEGGMLMEQNGIHADKGGCNAKDVLAEIFPKRKSFTNAPLNHHGLMGGAIDAWALTEITEDASVTLHCFDNMGDKDDLHYSDSDYGLLPQYI